MQEARKLLMFSSTPITETCFQSGFKGSANFAYFLRRYTGITASENREKNQKIKAANTGSTAT